MLPPIRALETTSIVKDSKGLGELKDLKKIGKKPTTSKLQLAKKLDDVIKPTNVLHQTAGQTLQVPPIQPALSQQPLNIIRNMDAE